MSTLQSLEVGILTIFPDAVGHYLETGVLGRARTSGQLRTQVVDLRVGADDRHRSVDDAPFGGGAGMVLAPEPVFKAVERTEPPRPIYLLSPGGRRFDQAFAAELATLPGFSLLAARYEGVDERIVEGLCAGEISIGDYVLAGGELAALVVLEAVARLVPGVLGNEESTSEESFAEGLLEYPQYTRPADFRGLLVPEVLRSGDHGKVAAWRRAAALARTIEHRPDLIEARGGLSDAEVQLLAKHGYPLGALVPATTPPGADGADLPFEERDPQ